MPGAALRCRDGCGRGGGVRSDVSPPAPAWVNSTTCRHALGSRSGRPGALRGGRAQPPPRLPGCGRCAESPRAAGLVQSEATAGTRPARSARRSERGRGLRRCGLSRGSPGRPAAALSGICIASAGTHLFGRRVSEALRSQPGPPQLPRGPGASRERSERLVPTGARPSCCSSRSSGFLLQFSSCLRVGSYTVLFPYKSCRVPSRLRPAIGGRGPIPHSPAAPVPCAAPKPPLPPPAPLLPRPGRAGGAGRRRGGAWRSSPRGRWRPGGAAAAPPAAGGTPSGREPAGRGRPESSARRRGTQPAAAGRRSRWPARRGLPAAGEEEEGGGAVAGARGAAALPPPGGEVVSRPGAVGRPRAAGGRREGRLEGGRGTGVPPFVPGGAAAATCAGRERSRGRPGSRRAWPTLRQPRLTPDRSPSDAGVSAALRSVSFAGAAGGVVAVRRVQRWCLFASVLLRARSGAAINEARGAPVHRC